MNNVHFSSKTDNWSTPDDFFKKCEEEFGTFDLDVCASQENAKAKRFFTREDDGLSKDWDGELIWMNPPYGREISKWIKKAHDTSWNCRTVVCLVPARTDTRWWHDYIQGKAEVRFIRGRLKFGSSKSNAPFPSALVIFWPDWRT